MLSNERVHRASSTKTGFFAHRKLISARCTDNKGCTPVNYSTNNNRCFGVYLTNWLKDETSHSYAMYRLLYERICTYVEVRMYMRLMRYTRINFRLKLIHLLPCA